MQPGAGGRPRPRRGLESRCGEDRVRAVPRDERAHPPWSAVAGSGACKKGAREPRRRLGDVGRRTQVSERVVARKTSDEHCAFCAALGFEADVRVDVGERQATARVEDEAEFRRQGPEGDVPGEAAFECGDAVGEIERGSRIQIAQRARNDVAQPLDLGVGVDQAGSA